MAVRAPAIGIDLGTTCSCVGVFQHGKVEIIANDQGNRTTPSYVAFTETERLIGDAAKTQATRNACNTVHSIKRLIGRHFNDATVTSDRKHWPFEIVDEGGRPKIKVEYREETNTTFYVEEIISMILTKLKETAESYLGMTVSDAVITVPAYFNDLQRQATRDSAIIAGLNVLRIISEPTAAAIAYGLDKKVGAEKNVLVFDIGSGNFSLLIMTIENGIFDVQSTFGDTHLGGEDFDNRMVSHLMYEFKHKYKKDISNNARSLRRLRTACEKAKHTLSSSTQASIEIDSLFEGIDFYTTVTRDWFEMVNDDLFCKTVEHVEKVLRDAELRKSDIHEVVLVGGSTRIPKIKRLLKDFLNVKELNHTMNPDEAVAYGAAIHAAILCGDKSEEIQDLLLLDQIPYCFGVASARSRMMVPVLMCASTIPKKESVTITVSETNVLNVYEGNYTLTYDNNLIGQLTLADIDPTLDTKHEIEVTFDIDRNWVLNVSAINKDTDKKSKMTITNDKGRLSAEEIECMVRKAEEYKAEDNKRKERISARNELENYVFSTKSKMEDDKVSKDKCTEVIKKCKEVIDWLDENQMAEKEEFEQQRKELERVCMPIVTNLCKSGGATPGSAKGFPGGFSGARGWRN